MTVLLDTHIWIWWLNGQEALPERERAAIDDSATRQEVCLSAISLWEAQMLHAKGRLDLPLPFPEWLGRAAAPGVVRLLPLDARVVTALAGLPRSFHGDPADRIIVATARIHQLPLATHGERIRAARSARIWKPSGRRQMARRSGN